MNDKISDFLIRIKNASMAGIRRVVIPHSKGIESLANVLKNEGLLETVEVAAEKNKKNLIVTIGLVGETVRPLEVKRISKPGRKMYIKAKDIKKSSRGLGILVISTPKGLMANKEAVKNNLGGEIICKIQF